MASRLRQGELSSRELVEAHLDVAERENRALNAWLSIDRESALVQADAADAAGRRPRRGRRDAIRAPPRCSASRSRDLISVEGGQCTAGSRMPGATSRPYDAHITERLRDVGAVLLGKTNMDAVRDGLLERAQRLRTRLEPVGPEKKPCRVVERRLGGGRGRAYHAAVSLGTDTGGSIRQPAALTGIVG
jgi:aspartyl-tRNA(Asn)/glutamyl-tRNA(Gln) amidotransferase subunit A